MSTKFEINISTTWDIFKVEIQIFPEEPGWKLVSKSSWGGGLKEGRGIFFLISLGGTKRGRGGNWLFISLLVGGEKYVGCYAFMEPSLTFTPGMLRLFGENLSPGMLRLYGENLSPGMLWESFSWYVKALWWESFSCYVEALWWESFSWYVQVLDGENLWQWSPQVLG